MKKILLVDDNAADRNNIISVLALEEYEIKYVTNGKEAILILDTYKPDLILLDIKMEIMDGIEFMKALLDKKILGSFNILVLSGFTTSEDVRIFCEENGINRIPKNLPLSEKILKIKEILLDR